MTSTLFLCMCVPCGRHPGEGALTLACLHVCVRACVCAAGITLPLELGRLLTWLLYSRSHFWFIFSLRHVNCVEE